MKILKIKKNILLFLPLILIIESANAGILSDIHEKFSNAKNKVAQKFELKKKYENTKAFVKKHKKAVIGASILTAVIATGLIYKFVLNANNAHQRQPLPHGRLPLHILAANQYRRLQQSHSTDPNIPPHLFVRIP